MWENLSEFWKYNISNIRKDLSDEELKEEGGVCWQYSDWYVEQAKSRGLMGKKIEFWGSEDIGHAIAIVYDKEISQYCILDQMTTPKCTRMGVVNE